MLPIRSLFSLFLALGLLGLISSPKVLALSASDLLPAEEAFRLSHHEEPSSVVFRWDIADGYHLYRKHYFVIMVIIPELYHFQMLDLIPYQLKLF